MLFAQTRVDKLRLEIKFGQLKKEPFQFLSASPYFRNENGPGVVLLSGALSDLGLAKPPLHTQK